MLVQILARIANRGKMQDTMSFLLVKTSVLKTTTLQKMCFDLISEFNRLPRPDSDMEFRSLCSQKFAQAFYQSNK